MGFRLRIDVVNGAGVTTLPLHGMLGLTIMSCMLWYPEGMHMSGTGLHLQVQAKAEVGGMLDIRDRACLLDYSQTPTKTVGGDDIFGFTTPVLVEGIDEGIGPAISIVVACSPEVSGTVYAWLDIATRPVTLDDIAMQEALARQLA